MRRGHYMSLSFLDILIGFLGSILFMFIVVDKGVPAAIDVPDSFKELPEVHAYFDKGGNLIHNLKYSADVALELGTPYLLILDSNQEMEIEECPPCPDCEDGNVVIACPNPAHHKQKLCQDPDAHRKKNLPIACNKIHCNEEGCEPKIIIKEKVVEKIIIDPISIPYELGFAVYDNTSISRDVDIKVCSVGSGKCVSAFNKRLGELRWVDLKKSPIWESNRQVTGGEFIIAQKLVPGQYKIFAKYDVRKSSEQALKTEARVIVSTKRNNKLISNSKTISLTATPPKSEWKEVMKVSISSTGKINTIK